MGKYDALARYLESLPGDYGEVELTFGRIDGMVGGLPPSSRKLRTWWANNSQGQSLAWHRSGWHVRTVDLAGSSVVFARGQVGGSYAARGRTAASAVATSIASTVPKDAPAQVADSQPACTETVDARVVFEWTRLGVTTLDAARKLAFPEPLPDSPGLYRFTLTSQTAPSRIYIGESDNLRRRLRTNYRNPGPRQRTSLRINALLVEHLSAGAHVTVDISVRATLHKPGSVSIALDLNRKAGRLFAESAALVLAQQDTKAVIENLG